MIGAYGNSFKTVLSYRSQHLLCQLLSSVYLPISFMIKPNKKKEKQMLKQIIYTFSFPLLYNQQYKSQMVCFFLCAEEPVVMTSQDTWLRFCRFTVTSLGELCLQMCSHTKHSSVFKPICPTLRSHVPPAGTWGLMTFSACASVFPQRTEYLPGASGRHGVRRRQQEVGPSGRLHGIQPSPHLPPHRQQCLPRCGAQDPRSSGQWKTQVGAVWLVYKQHGFI